MSSRFGISRSPWSAAVASTALGHRTIRSTNRSKRYAASCGPAAASGWYCTEKRLQPPVVVAQLEPLDHVVVEADVARPSPRRTASAVGRVERRVDREAVVVRGHLDLAGGAVHHRLVDAAVAVGELVGARSRAPGRRAGCRSRCRSRGCPRSSAPRSSSTWPVVAAGSPGPLEKNSPSGADRAARRRGSRWPAARGSRCRARPSSAGCSP